MNWVILIIAGFFESGFAFCLGKMKGILSVGSRIPHLFNGQHGPFSQSRTDVANRHSLSGLDGYRSGRYGCSWHSFFSRTHFICTYLFHHNLDCLDCRIKNGLSTATPQFTHITKIDFSTNYIWSRFFFRNKFTSFSLLRNRTTQAVLPRHHSKVRNWHLNFPTDYHWCCMRHKKFVAL